MSAQNSHLATLLRRFALPLLAVLFYYGLAEAQSSLEISEPAATNVITSKDGHFVEPARGCSLLKKESRTVLGACGAQSQINPSPDFQLLSLIDDRYCLSSPQFVHRARSPPKTLTNAFDLV